MISLSHRRNQNMVGHPMHLSGHDFKFVPIDGRRSSGALRDTVWVPMTREVTVAFGADNHSTWTIHCDRLYHMAAGMFTTAVRSASQRRSNALGSDADTKS